MLSPRFRPGQGRAGPGRPPWGPRPWADRLRKVRDFPGVADELQDVHAGVGAVDDEDVPAVVDIDVVRLDGDLAGVDAPGRNTPLIGVAGGGGNVEGDLRRIERVADVHGPDPGVEPGEEHYALVVDRGQVLTARVRPKASAALAV